MYFGNKDVLEWESARDLERKWLTDANIKSQEYLISLRLLTGL